MKKSIVLILTWLAIQAAGFADPLTLSTNSSTISLNIAATDYSTSTGAATVTFASGTTLTVKNAQGSWTLSAQATTATFGFTASAGDPNPNKPSSDLAIRQPGYSSTFQGLTTTPFTLVAGPKGANLTQPVDYQIKGNLSTDPPGSYTISIIFTLTSP